jgi:hypothetical protein
MMNYKYDLCIGLRCYPGFSGGHALFNNDKLLMVKVCFRSLIKSISNLKTKLVVLNDLCPESFDNEFRTQCEGKDNIDLEIIHIPEDTQGKNRNHNSYNKQTEVLFDNVNEAEVYLYLEDDYLFTAPNELEEVVSLFREHPEVDFCTPFRHWDIGEPGQPGNHPYHNFNREYYYKIEHCGRTWDTQQSTCCSYALRTSVAEETRKFISSYETRGDHGMFIYLTDSCKEQLITPARDGRTPEDKVYPLYTVDRSIMSHVAHNTHQRSIGLENLIQNGINEVINAGN